jgi:glycosyltransferase involved in cell wall biosynthesis
MWSWTGIGTYIQVLLEGFSEVGADHEIHCLVRPGETSGFPIPAASEAFRLIPCDVPVYSMGEMRGLAKALRALDYDLVHFPHYIFPYREGLPAVVTIHDLIHLRFPSYHKTPLHFAYARHVLPRSARSARRVIAVSHHTKEDIVTYLGVSPEKVKVIHNGLPRRFMPGPKEESGDDLSADRNRAAERIQKETGLTGPYILYVGNAKKHKNLDGLIRAFRLLLDRIKREKTGQAAPTLALTARREDLRGKAARLSLEGVRFLGKVSGDLLVDLYRGAGVFAFSSRYEGFGYPPLEAMACGTPVVCSNAASLPEVVGEAAIQVAPDDLDHLSSALYDLLTKEDLCVRLRNEGLRRARMFTAQSMAEETLNVYDEVARTR